MSCGVWHYLLAGKTITKGSCTCSTTLCCVRARQANSLVDSVVDEQLREDGSEEGGGDAQTKAAPGPIKGPPQAQGQGCERQRELHVVVKVQFLC